MQVYTDGIVYVSNCSATLHEHCVNQVSLTNLAESKYTNKISGFLMIRFYYFQICVLHCSVAD